MENKKDCLEGISSISVRGFKSLANECCLEIRPLTILAGANSSGKSSAMQPLLLLKQTLDATYDPGPIRLDGPNVRFTSAAQLLSHVPGGPSSREFEIGIEIGKRFKFEGVYRQTDQGFAIEKIVYADGVKKRSSTLHPKMNQEAIVEILKKEEPRLMRLILRQFDASKMVFKIIRERCYLVASASLAATDEQMLSTGFNLVLSASLAATDLQSTSFNASFGPHIRKLIHVPALRWNPLRTYQTTAIGTEFPGTFENYIASAITNWQRSKDERLQKLQAFLKTLGLTWKVVAKQINDTQVELRVGRLQRSTRAGAHDLVNIADVGFGVSQVLPVLVALLAAETGQLVYIEQPELHLHPRAQTALAEILADAAKRGVRVVVETHSQLLLTAIQTLVAEGKLAPEKVKLHWFSRRDDGVTEVSSADLDENGAFGDWPEDFAEVTLQAEGAYLDAAMAKSLSP